MAAPQAIASSSTSDCASHLDGTITTSAARRWGAASSTAPTNSTRSATPARTARSRSSASSSPSPTRRRRTSAVRMRASASIASGWPLASVNRPTHTSSGSGPTVGDRPVRREPVGVDTVADDDDTIGRPAEHLETDRAIVVRDGDDHVRQRRGRPLERTVGRRQRAAHQPRPPVRGEHRPGAGGEVPAGPPCPARPPWTRAGAARRRPRRACARPPDRGRRAGAATAPSAAAPSAPRNPRPSPPAGRPADRRR